MKLINLILYFLVLSWGVFNWISGILIESNSLFSFGIATVIGLVLGFRSGGGK